MDFAVVIFGKTSYNKMWSCCGHILPDLGVDFLDVRVGDILTMKKKHPCGENRFLVLRSGMDFRIRCVGCGREFMIPRLRCEKNIKAISRSEAEPKP